MKFLVWICAVALCHTTFAYDIAEFEHDAKAHHTRHLKGMNGLALDVRGTITQPDHDVYTIDATYSTRGNKWRTDAVLKNENADEGFPITVLFDGQQTWAQVVGMKLKIRPSDVDNRIRGYVYWDEPAAGSQIVGEETVQGRSCWVISTPLKEEDGTDVTMKSWYDKEYFVLVQSESTLDAKPVRMEFSDFRGVNGTYVIPHKMRAVQDGVQIVDAQVLKASSGSTLRDALFDAEYLDGGDFPDMGELMRTMQIFGKVFTNEVSKLLKSD